MANGKYSGFVPVARVALEGMDERERARREEEARETASGRALQGYMAQAQAKADIDRQTSAREGGEETAALNEILRGNPDLARRVAPTRITTSMPAPGVQAEHEPATTAFTPFEPRGMAGAKWLGEMVRGAQAQQSAEQTARIKRREATTAAISDMETFLAPLQQYRQGMEEYDPLGAREIDVFTGMFRGAPEQGAKLFPQIGGYLQKAMQGRQQASRLTSQLGNARQIATAANTTREKIAKLMANVRREGYDAAGFNNLLLDAGRQASDLSREITTLEREYSIFIVTDSPLAQKARAEIDALKQARGDVQRTVDAARSALQRSSGPAAPPKVKSIKRIE